MIRWQDIQNLIATEDEINSLSGLTSSSTELNALDGYLGTTSDLNSIIGLGSSLASHISESMVAAHTPTAGSLDGLVIAAGTITEDRLSFDIATQIELDTIDDSIGDIVSDLNVQIGRINNLYGVVFPGQGNDIANAIQQCIDHIEDVQDAHDASAISYGELESGYYALNSDIPTGVSNTILPLDIIRYFRENDDITFDDDISIAETVTINTVNYNTGYIEFSPATTTDFLLVNQAKVTNEDERNLQEAVGRSLRDNTDLFTGQLSIYQDSTDHALVLSQTGTGDELHFTSGRIGEDLGYDFTLKSSNKFEITNNLTSNQLFEVNTDASAIATTFELKEEGTVYTGKLDKETLTANRTWILPNEDGAIALGDASHTTLLKVSADNVAGMITVAAGHRLNTDGEIIRAWVTMEVGSSFDETLVNLTTKLTADGHLPGLGSSWIACIVHLDESDNLLYSYSPYEAIEQDAIDGVSFVPSIYMKLALYTVKGDGAGGIDASTLSIKEDLRPFLNIGMATVYYDESIYYPSILSAFTPITLPLNSRAGNTEQKYNVGAGQLETYINDRFVEPIRDYNELAGSPAGQISFKYDLPADTVVRFRIEHHSAGAPGTGGGVGSITLHNAYLTGSTIATDITNGPVTITDNTGGANKALVINGDIDINGFIDPPTGYGLTSQASEPGDLSGDYHKLYANADGELIYKQYDVSSSKFTNIMKTIQEAESSQQDTYTNVTGLAIPAYSVVALHPSLPKHIVLANVSSNTSLSRIIGVTAEEIAHNNSGKIVTNGRLIGAGTSFTHNHLLFANPLVAGEKISETLLSLTTGNVSVIIGTVDGNDLLINLNRQGEVSN